LKKLLIAFLAGYCGALGARSDDGFESIYARAKQDVCCDDGVVYDHQLGAFFEARREFKSRMDGCLKDNSGPQSVRGYFSFAADGSYRVVLRPSGKFASCVADALEGQSVPRPPRLPYFNPFDFRNSR